MIINEIAAKRVQKIQEQLGDLSDEHIKFIFYFLKDIVKFDKFRIELRYLETPRKIIIHLFTKEGVELYCKPKPVDLFEEMVKYLKIDNEWTIEYAKKNL